MAYSKQTWTDDVSAVTGARMTHIEQGIYDNSLATDKINPSGTATTTAEIEEGQISDVIGFKSLKLKGQTSQYTTTGKNKLEDDTFVQGSYLDNTSTIRISCRNTKLKANTTYTLSSTLNYSNYNIAIVTSANQFPLADGSSVVYDSTWKSANFSFTTGNDEVYINISIKKLPDGVTITPDDVKGIKFQIEEGSSATSYEKFSGGKASPNPDFPQEVNTVSGDNVIAINGSKNLFDKDINIVTPGYLNANGAVVTSDATLSYQNRFIKVQPSTAYTISSDTSTIYRIAEYTSNKTFIARTSNANASRSYTFATSSQTHYIKMAGTLTTVLSTLQIEKGNTATSYVAHQGNNFEINLGKNLFNKENIIEGKRLSNDPQNQLTDAEGYYTSSFIKVNPNTTYTKNSPLADAFHRFAFYSSNSESGYLSISNENTIVTPSECEYVRFSGEMDELDTTQLEKGVATTYAPYFEPILLGSLGTKTNDIRRKDGKWYWHKEMRKATYNGSEDWRSNMTWDGNVGDETMHFYINTVSDWLVGQTEYKSEKFIGTIQTNRNLNLEEMTCHTTTNSLYVFLKATRIGATSASTEAQRITLLKAWLANNNFSVYYQLLTPKDEEITYAPLLRQLDELYNSGLYDVTNISQDNSSEAFILDLEACKNNINGIVEYIRR